jgi:hypothetical protein
MSTEHLFLPQTQQTSAKPLLLKNVTRIARIPLGCSAEIAAPTGHRKKEL